MLIELNEHGIASIPVVLVKHVYVRELEINPTKIQGPSTSVQFVVVPWYEAY